jgi:drug/metabolite transporter (DMT)-like permease
LPVNLLLVEYAMSQPFYIGLAIITNFIWGLAFLAPHLLDSVSPAAIAFGRYVCYGLIALALIPWQFKSLKLLTRHDWLIAAWFALCGNVGYYLLLAGAIHYSGIAVSALIIGTVPITMMVSANVIERRLAFRQLVLPLGFILAGLALINIYKFSIYSSVEDARLLWGILLAVGALAIWTWYGIHNIYYLKDHPHIRSQPWTIAVGLNTFLQAIVGSAIYFGMLGRPFFLQAIPEASLQETLLLFVASCLVLGVVVSWLGTFMWNIASRNLPAILAGQAIVFEIIASILYGHVWDATFPGTIELISIALIVFGILSGVYVMNRRR